MNFFEIVFLCYALIYGIFLIGFLTVFIYDTIIENMEDKNKEE